jgi:hypothetical protein
LAFQNRNAARGDGYPYEAVDCQDELKDPFVCLGF